MKQVVEEIENPQLGMEADGILSIESVIAARPELLRLSLHPWQPKIPLNSDTTE